jgi:ABC-type Mn2+/Zn2+ transport system permease subunit
MASFTWIPGIGDPTLAGWLTVVLYFVTSLSCWKSGREAEFEDSRRSNEYWAWRSIAILFLALGVNKQFNLITALTVFGRAVAYFEGWYGRRQPVQVVLIGLLAISSVLAVTMLLIWLRRAPIVTWFALIGTAFTVTFVLIRAVSYHYIDRFLFERILGLRWNWVIEIGGISVVLLASQWRQVRPLKSTSAPRVHR